MENLLLPSVTDGGKRRQRVQSAETGMTILKALARLGGAASPTAIAAEAGGKRRQGAPLPSSLTSEGRRSTPPRSTTTWGPRRCALAWQPCASATRCAWAKAPLLRLRESLW